MSIDRGEGALTMNALDRTCRKLRSVTITDDAGINHRINKFCGALITPEQMVCERCEDESARDEERAMSMEIQR